MTKLKKIKASKDKYNWDDPVLAQLIRSIIDNTPSYQISDIRYRLSANMELQISCTLSDGFVAIGHLNRDLEPYAFGYMQKPSPQYIDWEWEKAIISQIEEWMLDNPVPDFMNEPLRLDQIYITKLTSNMGYYRYSELEHTGFAISYRVNGDAQGFELLKNDLSGLVSEQDSIGALSDYKLDRNPLPHVKYAIGRAREIRQRLSEWLQECPISDDEKAELLVDANARYVKMMTDIGFFDGEGTCLEVRLPDGGTTILKSSYPEDFPRSGHREMGWDAFSQCVYTATKVGIDAQRIADFPFACTIEEYQGCYMHRGVHEHLEHFRVALAYHLVTRKAQGLETNGDLPHVYVYGGERIKCGHSVNMVNWIDDEKGLGNRSESDRRINLGAYLEAPLSNPEERSQRFIDGWNAYSDFVSSFTNAYVIIQHILDFDVGCADFDREYQAGILAHRDALLSSFYSKRHKSKLVQRRCKKEDKWDAIYEATIGWRIRHRKKLARRKCKANNGVVYIYSSANVADFRCYYNGYEYECLLTVKPDGSIDQAVITNGDESPHNVPKEDIDRWIDLMLAKMASLNLEHDRY